MLNKLYVILIVGLVLGRSTAHAQDSLLAEKTRYQLERMSNLQGNRINGTTMGALRPYRWKLSGTDVETGYSLSDQQQFDWQKGAGEKAFDVTTRSYLHDLIPNTTVWGNAQYISSTIKDVNYNESLDYDRIFPYFLADSIGGNLKRETYNFGGGLARMYGLWTLAADLQIQSAQSYRQRDPRPNNTSSVFSAELSLARKLALPYTIGLSVEGELYKQTNILGFVSELGRPLIFNLNGLGVYNNLLTGTEKGSSSAKDYFKTRKVGAAIQFIPDNKGLWFGTSLSNETGDKQSTLSYDDINNWTDNRLALQLGYDGNWGKFSYNVAVHTDIQRRKGNENLFTNQNTESGLVKIAELSTYRYFQDRFGVNFTFGKQLWNIKFRGFYRDMKEQYLSPYRTQELQQLDLGMDLQYFLPMKKQLLRFDFGILKTTNLSDSYVFRSLNPSSGLGQLLDNNIDFLRQEPLYITGKIRWDLPTIQRWRPYMIAETQHASGIGLHQGLLKVGFVF